MRYEIRQTPSDAEIVVRLVEDPDGPASEVWAIEYFPDGEVNPQEAVEELISSTFDEEYGFPTFVLDRHQSHYEWGAEGFSETFVLSIAAALAYDVLKAAFAHVVELIRASAAKPLLPPRPLTEVEAVERARARLGASYRLDGDALVLVGVSQSTTEWIVTFRLEGTEYQATLQLLDDYPVFTQVKMSRLNLG